MTSRFDMTLVVHLPHGICHGNPRWDRQPIGDQLDDCNVCPAQAECLRAAIEQRMTGVVMGGAIFPDVRSHPVRRTAPVRGRPKKEATP